MCDGNAADKRSEVDLVSSKVWSLISCSSPWLLLIVCAEATYVALCSSSLYCSGGWCEIVLSNVGHYLSLSKNRAQGSPSVRAAPTMGLCEGGAVYQPAFVFCLHCPNPISSSCSSKRLLMENWRGGGSGGVIMLKHCGGNLFSSTQHSWGRLQQHSPWSTRASSMAMKNTMFLSASHSCPQWPPLLRRNTKTLPDKRGPQGESEF